MRVLGTARKRQWSRLLMRRIVGRNNIAPVCFVRACDIAIWPARGGGVPYADPGSRKGCSIVGQPFRFRRNLGQKLLPCPRLLRGSRSGTGDHARVGVGAERDQRVAVVLVEVGAPLI